MATARYTMKIHTTAHMLERVRDAADYAGVSVADFVHSALERALREQEVRYLKAEVTMEELRRNVLNRPQSVAVPMDEAEEAVCQLCLKPFVPAEPPPEGPLLCEDCLALAKGGDFSVVMEPTP